MAGQGVSGGGGSPLILIVEDYDDTRALLSLTLSKKGYRMMTASDGTASYGLALSERPDLILMDIHMPGIDELSVTRLLREREETCGVPIRRGLRLRRPRDAGAGPRGGVRRLHRDAGWARGAD